MGKKKPPTKSQQLRAFQKEAAAPDAAPEYAAVLELLNMAAWLAPDEPISRSLFLGLPGLPEPVALLVSDARRFRQGLELLRVSNIWIEGDSFQLSSEMQYLLRVRLKEQGRMEWGELALRALDRALPDPEGVQLQPEAFQILFSHVVILAGHVELRELYPGLSGSVYSRLALYMRVVGEAEEAKRIFGIGLGIVEEYLAPDAPEAAPILRRQAQNFIVLGEKALAEQALVRAVSILDANPGRHWRETVDTLLALGQLYNESRNVTLALPRLERALRLVKAAPERDELLLSKCLTHLAGTQFLSPEMHFTALKNVEKALELAERVAPRGVQVLTCRNSLGVLRHHLKDPEGAEADMAFAIKLHEEIFGEDHSRRGRMLERLASIRAALVQKAQAKATAAQDVPEAETQDVPEAETQDVPEAETQDVPEAETQDVPEAETQDVPEAETQDVPEAETQDVPEPSHQPEEPEPAHPQKDEAETAQKDEAETAPDP